MKTWRGTLTTFMIIGIVVVAQLLPLHIVHAEDTQSTDANAQYPVSAADVQRQANGVQSIPTTSNPTGNGIQGLRTYANTSFEESDFACFTLPSGWAYINQTKMRGWKTAHPLHNETNCTPAQGGIRVLEIQK